LGFFKGTFTYYEKMSFCKQPTFASKVFVDEVSSADHKKLCILLETILAWAVSDEVHKLCKERCCGCEVDHPSQRRHDCLMLTIEEKWITYGLEAIERVSVGILLHVLLVSVMDVRFKK
jgi:hypothetical protein